MILTCQARYRSHRRSSYQMAVKLGGDKSWGRISDKFVHGRHGSLIKCWTSWLTILTCQARYRSHRRSSYQIAVKLGGDESWGRISDEFVIFFIILFFQICMPKVHLESRGKVRTCFHGLAVWLRGFAVLLLLLLFIFRGWILRLRLYFIS